MALYCQLQIKFMSLIAIISDIHGNLPALKTVLDDIKKRNIEEIYCLGDLVDFAPWTNEVIQLIRDSAIPCIMGNHDERIAFDEEIIPVSKHSPEETYARTTAINITKYVITEENKQYLSQLPAEFRLTFEYGGSAKTVLLVHASTNSNDEYIYESHDQDLVRQMLDDNNADVLIMGHTHKSYIKTIHKSGHPDKLAINAGSVGRSREGEPLACYLILNPDSQGIHPQIIKLDYPIEETVEAIRKSKIPDFYADFLLLQG